MDTTRLTDSEKAILERCEVKYEAKNQRINLAELYADIRTALATIADLRAKLERAEKVVRLISPCIDELINRTPTGAHRDRFCDINIEVKQALAAYNAQEGR